MAFHPTYQVRELSTSAVEIWALRALRGEVIARSTTYYLPPTTYHLLLTTYYYLLPPDGRSSSMALTVVLTMAPLTR